jgi:hypothetical protein
MGRPIYVDLDATLIDSDVDELGNVVHIEARPGAAQFLQKLSKHGDLFLLTHAMRPHVKNAFRVIGKSSKLFVGVISREDMEPVIEQIDYIVNDPRLTDEEKGMLYQEIRPLSREGMSSTISPWDPSSTFSRPRTVGAKPNDWIKVRPFKRGRTGGQELDRAYREYLRRSGGESAAVLSGRAIRVTG